MATSAVGDRDRELRLLCQLRKLRDTGLFCHKHVLGVMCCGGMTFHTCDAFIYVFRLSKTVSVGRVLAGSFNGDALAWFVKHFVSWCFYRDHTPLFICGALIVVPVVNRCASRFGRFVCFYMARVMYCGR